MPSIAAHMVCAKIVGEKLEIDDDDFILGNILPDISSNIDSHNKIEGRYFYIPNIDYWKKKLDYSNNLNKGYLCHLLLDKYFLEYFIPNNIDSFKTIFETGIIYEDYSAINSKLVKDFKINVDKVICIINNTNYNVDKNKKEKNICHILQKKCAQTKKIDYDLFANFLYEISNKIAKELGELENDKCSKLRIYTR